MLKCMKYKFFVLEKYFLKISKNPQHFFAEVDTKNQIYLGKSLSIYQLPRWIWSTDYSLYQ